MKRKIGNLFFVDTFLLLLITTLALINPPQQDGVITPKAEAMLTVEWSDKQRSDVDTWIVAPNGDKLWFASKDHGHMILHRDDLGSFNDKYRKGANEIQINQNIEVADFVKLLDGQYIVSVHMYGYRDKEPVPVTVNLLFLEPFATVARAEHTFTANKQEIPFFSFTVKDGKIINVNYDIKAKLVNVGGNGA